ncbi:6962_t:CDS:2 [Paraglomus brasilianum]|uniref:6962_t:CDS:1 n=1 Tax=Paraglomus brasilianum TaxID=144538 RepID=A0A9N9G724_9GLOM|nr:6962_t:CDS:2 [Paraglomus brasilianum]
MTKGTVQIKRSLGGNIRERFTEYQLERKPPKTRPEYYDVIFFNGKKKDSFLWTFDDNIVQQMLTCVKKRELKDTVNHDIKSLLDNVIDRDIKKTLEKIKALREDTTSFEQNFAVKLIEDVNLFLDPMSEGTYIISVLGPILNDFYLKNKKVWYASYGKTCLKASAKDGNSQKADDERRSMRKKIDVILSLREEDEEFSVIEVSGPPIGRTSKAIA